jgi:glycopeptide antibiotics resistance protein
MPTSLRTSTSAAIIDEVRYLVLAPHTVIIVVAALLALVVALPWLRRRDLAGAARAASSVLLVGAVLAVLSTTLLGTTSDAGKVNLVPGSSIAALAKDDDRNAIENVFGNMALFVPLGFFGVLALRRGVTILTLLGVCLSVFIEGTQLLLGRRWVDIDDVLLNTVGAGLGATAAVVMTRVARRLAHRRVPVQGRSR